MFFEILVEVIKPPRFVELETEKRIIKERRKDKEEEGKEKKKWRRGKTETKKEKKEWREY